MQVRRMGWFLIVWSCLLARGQSGIGGAATISLTDGGVDCAGMARVVDVHVDVTGLSGVGGPGGLNAFALALNLDRPDVFASASAGEVPAMGWGLINTDETGIAATHQVILVGWAPDPDAPNTSYLVASIILSGAAGPVTLSLDAGASSLGSRVVAGDGPGPIELSGPPPLTVSIPESFDLDLLTGASRWLTTDPDYQLVPGTSWVTVLDLVKLVQCGG